MLNLTIISIFILSIISAISSSSIPLSGLRQELAESMKEIQLNGEPKEFDSSLRELLAQLESFQMAAPHSLQIEWEAAAITTSTDKKSVCIVVSSFEGMYINSGIGTAYYALANFLVAQGHKVTVVYTRDEPSVGSSWGHWVDFYKNKGITLLSLPPTTTPLFMPALQAISLRVYRYLASTPAYDIVHFADFEGHGFYPTLAKKVSNQFATTSFVVGLHGPTRWVLESNFARIPTDETEVDIDWMERMSVENADAVWTPSEYMASWMSVQGWTLPSSIHLLPLAPGPEFQDITSNSVTVHATEFVFFGRLEVRKGLVLFCDALDLFAKIYHTLDKEISITFLGRTAPVNGMDAAEYIAQRSAKWPFTVKIMSEANRKAALEYLMDSSASRVAVIPSLSDNAPYTVYECLYAGIPFLASSIPSISPLFAEDTDRSAHLFEVKPHHIVSKMAGAIRNGLKSATPSFTVSQAESVWTSFYAKVEPKAPVVVTQDVPLVSVVVTHYNRPELLKQAIASVEAQTYSEIEVVLVDDGSTDQAALNYLVSIESYFQEKNWKIIRGQNKYLGAARNAGAKAATGKYLLFLDDDNAFFPTTIASYVQAAKQTGASIITAGHAVFEGTQAPTASAVIRHWMPLGASLAAGLFKNTFGDANFFVEKAKFMFVGGFTEEKGVGLEEHEFFAKSIFNGTKLEVIPEVLLYYRQHSEANQMLYTTDMRLGEARRLRPYLAAVGASDSKQNDAKQNSRRSLVNLVARNALSPRATCNTTITGTITPVTGIYPGGYSVNITGKGFQNCGSSVSAVTIGGNACTDVSFTDSQITCIAPQGNSVYTPVNVYVTVGGTNYFAGTFTYTPTPPPGLEGAVLDNTGTVTVTFDQPTNKGGASKRSVAMTEETNTAAICQQLLDATTISKIGQYPNCDWLSTSSFYIQLSNDATLSSGDNITLPAGVVRGAGPQGAKNLYATTPVSVSGSFPPTASISTSSSVGVCQGIQLDGSGSTGSYGRDFTKVEWILSSSIKAPASSVNAITSALASASMSRSLVINLPANIVVAGAEYTFKLTVTNWYALSDATTAKVDKSTAAVPIVSVSGSAVRSIYKETPVTLYGVYSGLACSNSTSNADGEAVFSWTVSPSIGSFSGSSSQIITIPAGTLSASQTYVITFTVSDVDSGASNSASVTVVVVPHPIIAVLLGGGTQFGLNSTITLDASQSQDPELLGPLTFSWGCYSQTTTCNYAFTNSDIQTFLGSDIGVGTFVITVTVSGAANRSAIASTTIVVTQLPFLRIHIEAPYTTYAKSQTITLTGIVDATDASLSDITFAWSTSGVTLSNLPYPNGVSSRILVIAPNSLQEGTTYTYTLVATHTPTGVSGIASISIAIIPIVPSNNTVCAQPDATITGSYFFNFGDVWQYAAGVNSFQVFYSFPPSTISYPLTAPISHYSQSDALPVGKLQMSGYGSSSTGISTTFSCSASVAVGNLATIAASAKNASDFYALAVDTFSLYNSKITSNADFLQGRLNILESALSLATSATALNADQILLSTSIMVVVANPKNGQLGIQEIVSLGTLTFAVFDMLNAAAASGSLPNAQILSALNSMITTGDYVGKQLFFAQNGVVRSRSVQDASPYADLIAASNAAQAKQTTQANPWNGATTVSQAEAASAAQSVMVTKALITYLPIGPYTLYSDANVKNFYKDTPSSVDSSGLQISGGLTNTVITLAPGFIPTPLLGGSFVAYDFIENNSSDIALPANYSLVTRTFNLNGYNGTADVYNMSTTVTVLVPKGSILYPSNATANNSVNTCYMYTNGSWTQGQTASTTNNDTLCTYPTVATFAVLNHAIVAPIPTDEPVNPIISTSGNPAPISKSGGLSGGAIAGIVIGVVAAVVVAAVLGTIIAKRRNDDVVTGRPSPRYGDSGVGGVAIDPPLDPIFVPTHMGPMYVPPASGSAGPVYLNRSALIGQPGDAAVASPVIYGTFQQPPIAAVAPAAAAAAPARREPANDDFSSDSDSSEYSRSRSGSVSSSASSSSRSSRYSHRSSDDDTMESEIREIAGELNNNMPRNNRDRDELSDQMDME